MKDRYLILILIFCSSCATISYEIYGNKQEVKVNTNTNKSVQIVFEGDTLLIKDNKIALEVERGKQDLKMKVLSDSIEKPVTIRSKESFEYWLNIPGNYGIGMLVDRNSPNRYSYPRNIYLDLNKNDDKYSLSSQTNNTNPLYLHLSLPFINIFHFRPQGFGNRVSIGFLGFSAGLDYHYKVKKFLSFKAIVATDFLGTGGLFFIIPLLFGGYIENSRIAHFELTDNVKSGKFSFGYGMSYAMNRWERRGRDGDVNVNVNRTSHNIGLSSNIYYRISRLLNIGIVYRPTFYRMSPKGEFNYEHLISLDLAFKIKLRK